MKITVVIVALLVTLSIESQAQTYFYKRVQIIKNGQKQNTNDDGHYLTITDKCIYDSDADGCCEGNSNMKYIKTENGIKTYYGNSYHGPCYCFASSDFQRLNIKDDDVTYVYVRCTPTSGVKLRQKANSSSNPPVFITSPNSIPSSPGSNSSTTNRHRVCPSCNGSGKGVDQIYYRPDYVGNQADEYCPKCGKWGSPHSHRTPMCGTCYGKGYLDF